MSAPLTAPDGEASSMSSLLLSLEISSSVGLGLISQQRMSIRQESYPLQDSVASFIRKQYSKRESAGTYGTGEVLYTSEEILFCL